MTLNDPDQTLAWHIHLCSRMHRSPHFGFMIHCFLMQPLVQGWITV